MSMRDYAVDDYGLIMTRDMLKTICSKYCPDYTKKKYDNDECGFNNDLYEAGAAYHNMDDLVSELRWSLHDYLPIDFDYKKYIRHIVGTYYG